jgi:putative DNA primase/helicase
MAISPERRRAFLEALADELAEPEDETAGDRRDRARRHNGQGNETAADIRPPGFSDDALALRFADRHADELRYVAKWSTWLCWDGTHWQFDDTLNAFDRARVICREAAAGCNDSRLTKELASGKTVAAVERLARSDRRLAATADQWDADPWLLNTPKGVIDLRTGIMREHCAGDYFIHMTAVAPKGEYPLWRTFLERVTAGDKALQRYLQRVCGYTLTGSTREHALFFLWGKGANGKGTFVSAVAGILGEDNYHRSAAIETFTASHTDRHPTELADLRGARLVTATETEEGRRWAESRIKMLTGGDRVRARFMRQDLFSFVPQLKLMISGNHKPGLRSIDEAIRRRFNLIPFTVTILDKERDKELSEKLKGEWPGILAWMIEGCLAWQREGLNSPKAVTEATKAYLEAQDSIVAWLDECCELHPGAWERQQQLFASWKTWPSVTATSSATAKPSATASMAATVSSTSLRRAPNAQATRASGSSHKCRSRKARTAPTLASGGEIAMRRRRAPNVQPGEPNMANEEATVPQLMINAFTGEEHVIQLKPRYGLTPKEVLAFLAERKEEAKRIDPETCKIASWHTQVLDVYGIFEVPYE